MQTPQIKFCPKCGQPFALHMQGCGWCSPPLSLRYSPWRIAWLTVGCAFVLLASVGFWRFTSSQPFVGLWKIRSNQAAITDGMHDWMDVNHDVILLGDQQGEEFIYVEDLHATARYHVFQWEVAGNILTFTDIDPNRMTNHVLRFKWSVSSDGKQLTLDPTRPAGHHPTRPTGHPIVLIWEPLSSLHHPDGTGNSGNGSRDNGLL